MHRRNVLFIYMFFGLCSFTVKWLCYSNSYYCQITLVSVIIIYCSVIEPPKLSSLKHQQSFIISYGLGLLGLWTGYTGDDLTLFYNVWGLSWNSPWLGAGSWNYLMLMLALGWDLSLAVGCNTHMWLSPCGLGFLTRGWIGPKSKNPKRESQVETVSFTWPNLQFSSDLTLEVIYTVTPTILHWSRKA